MKDESRQPTSLRELEELLTPEGKWTEDQEQDVLSWLQWVHSFLSARKMYHKKARIRTAMLEKMAKTLLSKDELEAIDQEAEKQLGNLPDPESTTEADHELAD